MNLIPYVIFILCYHLNAHQSGHNFFYGNQWFEERHQQLETLESQFRRLQASLEGLYSHRRELAFATAALGKGLALLSNGEDHAGLSRALAKMAELHDKVIYYIVLKSGKLTILTDFSWKAFTTISQMQIFTFCMNLSRIICRFWVSLR